MAHCDQFTVRFFGPCAQAQGLIRCIVAAHPEKRIRLSRHVKTHHHHHHQALVWFKVALFNKGDQLAGPSS